MNDAADRAFANAPFIPGGDAFPGRWAKAAATFRDTAGGDLDVRYGVTERERYDLFRPDGTPAGLFVFVHGGYWMAFDKSSWSHLASGALEHGFAVAIPSYPLCPTVRLSNISAAVASAVAHAAAQVPGPIVLCGHSAGGQVVARLAALDTPLPAPVAHRILRTVPISGLHDLRPLIRTSMNETLGLDRAEARRESPALLDPLPVDLLAIVGDGERPELRRQTRLLAVAWEGLCRSVTHLEIPDRHHFDVIADLADPMSAMCQRALAT